MRRTLLAFFGFAFVIYWLWTADLPTDSIASLDPVLPNIVRMLPLPAKRALQSLHDSKDMAAESELRSWLNVESQKVGKPDANPSATVLRIKKRALSFGPHELEILKSVALNAGASTDERFMAVYTIGLAESLAAKEQLEEIGQSPLPQTANDRAYSDEVVIRAHALEALVQRLSPSASVAYLKKLLAKTSDPALARHARYWLNRLS